MALIFTEQFNQLPEEQQNKVKKEFGALIKGDKEQLHLSSCGLKGKEIRYNFVPNLKQIKTIDLSKLQYKVDGNKIGDKGAREIANANWTNLQTLELGIHRFYLDSNELG